MGSWRSQPGRWFDQSRKPPNAQRIPRVQYVGTSARSEGALWEKETGTWSGQIIPIGTASSLQQRRELQGLSLEEAEHGVASI